MLMTVKQIRDLEQQLKDQYHLSEYEFMHRAADHFFSTISSLYPSSKHWRIVCGTGNNAGDGLILAGIAAENNITVQVIASQDFSEGKALLKKAWEFCQERGVHPLIYTTEQNYQPTDLCIDAVLGIGIQGPLSEHYRNMISDTLVGKKPIVSLDLPSGLLPDNGQVDKSTVRATHTITVLADKLGLHGYKGRLHTGDIHRLSLGFKDSELQRMGTSLQSVDSNMLSERWKNRPADSHKGQFGRLVLIGSFDAYPGAICLAAQAAIQLGIGYTTVISHGSTIPSMLRAFPSIILIDAQDHSSVSDALEQAETIAIGPGLGRSDLAIDLLEKSIISLKPCIIDADALHLLYPLRDKLHQRCVLTPHLGEAKALLSPLGIDSMPCREDILEIISQTYQAVIVLKGAMTLIGQNHKNTWVCCQGNPNMAIAGMGDVLTGIIAAYCAQHHSHFSCELIAEAVTLHGKIADDCSLTTGIGLKPEDIIDHLHHHVP